MTKLIDVDALLNALQKLFDMREKEQRFTGGRGAAVTWNDAIYYIKSAPVIDAVPVSWLKEYVNRMYKENQIFVAYPIEDMLKAWESENA